MWPYSVDWSVLDKESARFFLGVWSSAIVQRYCELGDKATLTTLRDEGHHNEDENRGFMIRDMHIEFCKSTLLVSAQTINWQRKHFKLVGDNFRNQQ